MVALMLIMKLELPYSLGVCLAAYLRQAQLSLHRSTSSNELSVFFSRHSAQPRRILEVLLEYLPVLGNLAAEEYKRVVLDLRYSDAQRALLYIWASIGRQRQPFRILKSELIGIIRALQHLEEYLTAEDSWSLDAKNQLRMELSFSTEPLDCRIVNR